MNSIDAMKWRYAVKKFNPTKKLTTEQFDLLTEAVRLAPSSYGLQPWRLIVVSNPEIRAKLREAGYDQPQITDASHLFIFAAQNNLSDASVEHYMDQIVAVRGVARESLDGFATMLKSGISSRSQTANTEWATRQAYLGLGVLLDTCAISEIDACPMEGFNPAAFDEILGLAAHGLETKVIAAVGFRADDDGMASMKKVRFPKEEFVISVE